MIPAFNDLNSFLQKSTLYEGIDKALQIGFIIDEINDNYLFYKKILKSIYKTAKIIQITNSISYIVFNMEVSYFQQVVNNQFNILHYSLYSIIIKDTISLQIIDKIRTKSLKLIYRQNSYTNNIDNNIFYFCFNYDDEIIDLLGDRKDLYKIIEINVIISNPNIYFFSFDSFTHLINIYSKILQRKIWPIYVFSTKMSHLLHQKIVLKQNIQITKQSNSKFPIFEPEKFLFYVSFIESTIKSPVRIRDCAKLNNIYNISDVQMSHIFKCNRKNISINSKSTLFQTTRIFLGFDSEFRSHQVYNYLIESEMNNKIFFDVILLNKDNSFNFEIKANLFYLEVPKSFLFIENNNNSATFDSSLLYSINNSDSFILSENSLSSFFSFENLDDLLKFRELLQKKKSPIQNLRSIETDDIHDLFEEEELEVISHRNLSFLIFQLKKKNESKTSDFFSEKEANIIFHCQKDDNNYIVAGFESEVKRDDTFKALKKWEHSNFVKTYYPETFSKERKITSPFTLKKLTVTDKIVNFSQTAFDNSQINEFVPKEGVTYFYIEETAETRPFISHSTEESNTSLFGIKDIDDLQRYYFYPRSEKVCTFFGFNDREKAEAAFLSSSLQKAKAKGPSFFIQSVPLLKAQSHRKSEKSDSAIESDNFFDDTISQKKLSSKSDSNSNSNAFEDSESKDEAAESHMSFADIEKSEAKLSSKFKEFNPKPNHHYVYFKEPNNPNYSTEMLNATIFGIEDIDDVQRYFYFPRSTDIFTFLGFKSADKLSKAKASPTFNKGQPLRDYKAPIEIKASKKSSQPLIQIISKPKPQQQQQQQQQSLTTKIEPPKTSANLVIQTKKQPQTSQSSSTEKKVMLSQSTIIERPLKNTSLNIITSSVPKNDLKASSSEKVITFKPKSGTTLEIKKKSSSDSNQLVFSSSTTNALIDAKKRQVQRKQEQTNEIKVSMPKSSQVDNVSAEDAPVFQPEPNLIYFYFHEDAPKSTIGKVPSNSLYGVACKDLQRNARHPNKKNGILYTFFGMEKKEDVDDGIKKIKSIGLNNATIYTFNFEGEDERPNLAIINVNVHSVKKVPDGKMSTALFESGIKKDIKESISKAILESNLVQEFYAGIINTNDQNCLQTLYLSDSKETISKINGIIRNIICDEFNILPLDFKSNPYFYFDEAFIPLKYLNTFITYLKTIPGVFSIQRKVFFSNRISTYFYYDNTEREVIVNSIKSFLLKNKLLFNKTKYQLKNTIILNEDVIFSNIEDFNKTINEINKLGIKIVKIERNKLFVYEKHRHNKLLQIFSFIVFENEKDKMIALNHINQIVYMYKENILRYNVDLHYAKIQELSIPSFKKYINLIPNAADIQHKVFSIENPIPATYIGFKSINSLNFGMALFFFRMKTLHQFKNATFFTPEPHLKYIRYLYNQTPKYPQNYLDFHSNCLDLDDGNNVNYFNFVGFADENSINKITGNFQIVDNYSDVNEEENEELDILSDINERCFFNGMF